MKDESIRVQIANNKLSTKIIYTYYTYMSCRSIETRYFAVMIDHLIFYADRNVIALVGRLFKFEFAFLCIFYYVIAYKYKYACTLSCVLTKIIFTLK